jgi:hypothetical protein
MALLLLAGLAQGQSSGDYKGLEWQVNDEGTSINIYGYDGAGGAVSIPETITVNPGTTNAITLPVTSIGDFAFFFRILTPEPTEVTIPNTITTIGDGAFSGLTKLTSIIIPNSVTNIGFTAFQGCTSLTNATIGNDAVKGSTVTTMESSFLNCTNLTSVILGGNVTGLAEYEPVFSGCPLNRVTILDGVSRIGDGTFAGCTSLTNIAIPDSVISIGDTDEPTNFYGEGAFEGCTNLSSVTLGTGVTSLGPMAFQGCTALTRIVIPNSVTNLGSGAFESCTHLNSVTIGTNDISIGVDAFQGCADLGNIIIPNSVVSIGAFAFEGCTHLTSATIGDGVASIGLGAFGGSTLPSGIPVVGVPPLQPLPPITILPIQPFTNITVFTNVTVIPPTTIIPITNIITITNVTVIMPHTKVAVSDRVATIGDSTGAPAFGLINITVAARNPVYSSLNGVLFDKRQTTLVQFPCGRAGNYLIPGTVITIGTNAFLAATRLTSVTIPNSVIHVGNNPFSSCSSLTNITVETKNPAYSSANGVLFDRQRITLLRYPEALGGNYAMPNSVANIANDAFAGSLNLAAIALSINVTNIGDSSFADCLDLTRLIIPNKVTSIGSDAFVGCGRLAAISIPNSVTSMGEFAFMGCSGLANIVIPNHLGSMPYGVFEGCSGLTSLIIPESVTNIGPAAFSGCTRLKNVVIPNSVATIAYEAFSDCPGLTVVTIPGSVTNLEFAAFAGCTNLTEVFFQGNAPEGFDDPFGNWFESDTNTIVYYLPGATGWGSTSVGVPAIMANPTLTLLTNGLGKITPNDNGTLLKLGAQYTLTATPGPGFKFLNWTGGTNQPLTTLTNGPKLQFVMQLNQVLQANFIETKRPTVTITTPATGRKTTNALVILNGTASDDWGVAGVWYQLNNAAWQLASSTNNWTNWNTTLTLIAGTNIIKACALNLGGIYSTTNSVSIVSGTTFKLRLHFASARPVWTNGAALTLELSSNLTGHIEYSTDLINWVSWTNFKGNGDALNFRDCSATNSARRFYRAVVP